MTSPRTEILKPRGTMPYIVYTVPEKVWMVRARDQGLSWRRIVDHFAVEFPNRPIPTIKTVRKTVDKFRQTGNVNPSLVKVSQPRKQLSEEKKFEIFAKVAEDGRKPLKKIAQELDIAKSTVYKVLKQSGYRSYKFSEHHELRVGDPARRSAFCQEMLDRLEGDPAIRDRICFTDESTIVLVAGPNRQNVRVWDHENPHLIAETGTQYPQKLNMWFGMCGEQKIGPFFIEGNLTGAKYLRLLQERIVPALRVLEGDGPPIWFQQDGAPPHFTLAVREYLHQEFPGRWIGRDGPVGWPARSPDLTPLDYGLWACLKNNLYTGVNLENLQMLQAKVLGIIAGFSPEFISNMTSAFWKRLVVCYDVDGAHFEDLL